MNEAVFTLAVLLPLAALFLLWGYNNFKYGWTEAFNRRQQVAPVTSTGNSTAEQQRRPTPEQRMVALERIFPAPPTTEGRVVLVYDVESKLYVPDPDVLAVVAAHSCSICLEDFDTEACIVTGKCQHSYHRRCIMDWVKVDHDDCPNCRATMWDAEVFDGIHNA